MKQKLYIYSFCKEVMTCGLLILMLAFLLSVVGSEVSFVEEHYKAIFISVSVIIFCCTIIVGTLEVRHWKYSWDDDKITYQTGFLVVKETIIPMIRVMQISTAKNPLLTKWGLIDVEIITTTKTHRLLPITIEEGELFKDKLTDRLSTSGESDD